MQGIWKSYLGKNFYSKDYKIKNIKYKHFKKDKFHLTNLILNKEYTTNMCCILPTKRSIYTSSKNYTFEKKNFYFYKKKVFNYENSIYRYFCSLKKVYKKLSASKNRRILRDWIKKGNFEKELETFRFSKTILWEIY